MLQSRYMPAEAAVAKEVIIIVKKRPSLHPNNGKGDPRAKPKPTKLPACRREHKGDPKRPASITSQQCHLHNVVIRDIKDSRVKCSLTIPQWFQRATKDRQQVNKGCVRTLDEAVKLNHKFQWRPLNVEDFRTMRHWPRADPNSECKEPKKGVLCRQQSWGGIAI